MEDKNLDDGLKIHWVFKFWIVIAVVYFGFFIYKKYQEYDIDRKYGYAMEQCEKYGGQHGKVPIMTKGVYDHRRVPRRNNILERASVFINNGLEYVEFNKSVVGLLSVRGFKRGGEYYISGDRMYPYYRVYIAERGAPLCGPYEAQLKKGYIHFEKANLSDDQCIAVEGFDDPSLLKAPYELVVTDKVIDEGVPVEWNNLEVIDRSNGEVVAAYNTFSYCFTSYGSHAAEGFKFCRGIYGNPKVRPKCPSEFTEDSRVIRHFENKAFTYKREIK